MALRIVSLLLFALMAGPLSLSARAVARPENRVGGSPVFSSDFASQESAKPIGTPSENGGCGYDFALGVHKYLYCQGNPVDNTDPSGNDIGEMMSVMAISASLDALPGLSISPQRAVLTGSTCGPDVTVAVTKTIRDVEQTFLAAPNSTKSAAVWNIFKHPYDTMVEGWDIDKLVDLGYGGRPDFGNGSTLGSGLGKDTVQFSYGGPKVYRAGSVNYILWGKIFSLAFAYTKHNPLFSEDNAVHAAEANKALGHGQIFADYATEARAFVKFGYSGTEDPSSAAMAMAPNQKNKAAPSRFKWLWLKLHDNYE